MPKLTRKTVIGIKLETTQNTPVAVTATDFVLAEGVDIKPMIDQLERNYFTSSLDPLTSIAGKRWYEIGFKIEAKGSGSAGTANAPLGAALQACGFVETVSAGTSVTYAPTSAPASSNFYGPGKSVSIEIYEDGVKHVAAGCLGTVKFSAEAGKFGMFEFKFFGLYAAPTDSAPGTQTYLAQLPAPLFTSGLAIQSYNAIANKIDIDVANTVAQRPDTRSATGLLGFLITERKPVGTIDPELDTVANFDIWAKVLASTEGTMTFALGGTAGNIITFSMPKAQPLPFSYGDRNAIRTAEIPLKFNRSTGDDWCSIVFT